MAKNSIGVLNDVSYLFPTLNVLSDRGIRRNIRVGRIKASDIIDRQIQAASMDLRIGSVRVYDSEMMALNVIEYKKLSLEDRMSGVEPSVVHSINYPDESGVSIDIPPNSYFEIDIHDDIITSYGCRVDLRSSRGRLALKLTRDFFDGKTLKGWNHNPNTLRFLSRTPFAQMFFHTKTDVDGHIVNDPIEAESIGARLGLPTFGPYVVFSLGDFAFRYNSVGVLDVENKPPSSELYDKVPLNDLLIPPNETILAQLQPRVEIPSDIAIQLIDVPYMQMGCGGFFPNPDMFFCEPNRSNAGFLDPGFEGNVTAHIMRTKTPGEYNAGDPVVFGVISKFKEPVLRSYGSEDLDNHYQGSSGSVSKS